MKPWDGIVSAEDIASFGRGFAGADRPDLFDMHMKYADVISLDEMLTYLRSLQPAQVSSG